MRGVGPGPFPSPLVPFEIEGWPLSAVALRPQMRLKSKQNSTGGVINEEPHRVCGNRVCHYRSEFSRGGEGA